ncbi:hypothetical protein C9Z70_25215 (plasmid) [Escherichia coli]|nr:hypothetical protein C9Z76_27350 [Escherichia coli]TJP94141.1 hypothetical protein C9Z70_25215 [Escherichia coli]
MIAIRGHHLLLRSDSYTHRTSRENTCSNTFVPSGDVLQAAAFTGEGDALTTEVVCWAHARRKIHDVYVISKNMTVDLTSK